MQVVYSINIQHIYTQTQQEIIGRQKASQVAYFIVGAVGWAKAIGYYNFIQFI